MSLAFLLAGNRDTGIKIAGEENFALEFDLTLNEGHDFTSQVTKWPVEDGSEVADNIRNNPVSFSVTGFITNTPARILSLTAAQNALAGSVFGDGNDSVQDAYNTLLLIRDRRTLVDMVTTLAVYTNMAIEEVNFPVDTAESKLTIVLKLTQVVVVSTQLYYNPLDDQVAAEIDAGVRQALSPSFVPSFL